MSGRERVVQWEDPAIGQAVMPAVSGMDYLQAMIRGDVPPPPAARLLNFMLTEATPGRAVFTCEPDESLYNGIGTVHGGVICTLLDSAIGCAAQTLLPQGTAGTTIELSVNFLRAIRQEGGTLTCTGTVAKSGSRVSFASAELTDESGTVLATATSSLLMFSVA